MDTYWLLIFTTAFVLIFRYLYRYLKKPFTYWEERNVRSVPALPIIGSLYENFTQVPHEVLQQRYKKYGRIFGFYEGSKPVLSVADPDLLKDILVKDFHIFPNRREFNSGQPILESMISTMSGEQWKRVRTIITPTFSSGKIKRMSTIMLDASAITCKNFERFCDEGKPADCKGLFGTFTMDVIARSAFGTKLDSQNDPENEFIKNAKDAFLGGITLQVVLFFTMPKLLKFFGHSLFPKKPLDYFRDVALSIIKQRRKTNTKQNDFLQLLVDAAEETQSGDDLTTNEDSIEDESEKSIKDLGHDVEDKKIFESRKKYKGLSHDEVVAQCVVFFLAGYETSSSTLSLASYLLALNPECQERLIREIDDTLEKNQKKLTYEAVQSMRYLENVLWETLRLYPIGISVERVAVEDYVLGSTGITIPKGMITAIPIYPMHHDPEFYEDPERFDPDRFTPEEKNRRNPYTFLPFGAGPRNCIGMRFALIEIKFCIATLLSKFRLKRCPETKVPLEFFFNGQSMLQPKSILLHVERRRDSVF